MPKDNKRSSRELKGLTKKKKKDKKLKGLQSGGSLQKAAKEFTALDAKRRTGDLEGFSSPEAAALQDRFNEGKLIAEILPGVTEPVGMALLALAAGGFEAAKASGLTKFLPGPLGSDESTSDASIDNVLGALEGFRQGSQLFSNPQDVQAGRNTPGTVALPRGQTGGQVPVPQGVRVPTQQVLQQFQTGGIVEKQEQAADISPDVGGLEGVGQRLADFDPFGGAQGQAAQGALGNLLGGAPVDVSGIGDIARSQTQQQFGDFTAGLNEQVGALGLGSSSARTAAIAREAGRLGENVSNQILGANIAEQQQQAQRQAQGLGAFRGFGQQQLSGLSAGAGALGQAADLGLRGQVARSGALGQLTGQLLPVQSQQMNRVPQGQQQQEFVPASNFGRGGTGRSPGGLSAGVPNILGRHSLGGQSFQTGGKVQGRGTNVGSRAAGGEREDFGDFLSQKLFGQTFNRDVPQQVPINVPTTSAGQAVRAVGGGPRPGGLGLSTQVAQPFTRQTTDPRLTGPRARNEDPLAVARNLGREFIPARRANPLVGPGVSTARGLAILAQAGFNPATLGRQTGGKVPGPAVPPDQVPAEVGQPDGQSDVMLQGGEGIVPVDVMNSLQNFQGSPEDAVAIINTLRDIMGHAPGPRGPQDESRQTGGIIPTNQSRVGSLEGPFQGPDPTVPTFGLQGDPSAPLQSSGQVFAGGVDQSSQLASDRLRASQLRRRAAFFDSLIGQGGFGSNSPLLAEKRDRALAEAQLFEASEQAELERQSALQRQQVSAAGLIGQGSQAAALRAGAQGTGVSEDVREAVAAAQKQFFDLQGQGLIPEDMTQEQFIQQQLNMQGLQAPSSVLGEAQAAGQQQQAFGQLERAGQGREPGQPLVESPDVSAGLLGGEFGRAAREEAGQRIGQVAEGAAGAAEQIGTILDNIVGGIEAQPGAFAEFSQRFNDGNIQPEDIQIAQQLSQFFRTQAGRADIADIFDRRLAELGVQ